MARSRGPGVTGRWGAPSRGACLRQAQEAGGKAALTSWIIHRGKQGPPYALTKHQVVHLVPMVLVQEVSDPGGPFQDQPLVHR